MTLSRYNFFHFNINQHQGSLIPYTNFQLTIPNCSRENDNFISFTIFSNGGHLEFSTQLNFTTLKPWSLIMLHMKFKIHGCSGLRE